MTREDVLSRRQIRVPGDELLLSGAVEIDGQARLIAAPFLGEDDAVAIAGVADAPAAGERLRGLVLRLGREDGRPHGARRGDLLERRGRDLLDEAGGRPVLYLPVDQAAPGEGQRQLVLRA